MGSVQATTFTLFPELPSELRLKIWCLVILCPRTIPIKYYMKYDNFNGKRISTFSGWRSPDPVPVTLHICHEARVEALKSYELAFKSYFHVAKVYINFELDTVLFGADLEATGSRESLKASDYLLDVFLGGEYHGADDAEKIQRMIVDGSESLYDRRAFCWDEIRLFEGLKELKLRIWDEDDNTEWFMAYYRATLWRVIERHPDWVVPNIKIVSALSGSEWGTVTAPHAN